MPNRPSFPAEPAPAPLDPEAAARARALCERQMQVLGALAEAGMALARETVRRVEAAETAGAGAAEPDYSLIFSRIARAVRLTIALQSRLMADPTGLAQGKAQTHGMTSRAPDKACIEDEPPHDRNEVERRGETLRDRPDRDDIYAEIDSRPVGEIILGLCRDLDLSPDSSALAREAWAVAEAEMDDPASPFTGPSPAPWSRAPEGLASVRARDGYRPPSAAP